MLTVRKNSLTTLRTSERLSSGLFEAKGTGKFVGYTAAKGAYLIDIATDRVTPIIENTDIMQCKTDFAGENSVVLLHSGEMSIYNLQTGMLKIKANIIGKIERTETQKPQLVATKKYVYVTQPKSGEILQVEVANPTNITKIKTSAVPYRLTIVGMETSKGHDD